MNARTYRTALALALALSLPLAVGCSSGSSADDDTQETVEQTKEEEIELTDEDISAVEEDEKEDESAESPTSQATKRVGADGIGYVSVPDNWVEFKDVDGNSSIQWCDGTPYTIISLNTFDVSSVPEDMRADFSAEDAANVVWDNMLNDGVDEGAVQGARLKLANRDALQVYAMYPDGSYLVCWLAMDDAGVIRYVSAEGPENTILDAVDIVNNTYEF